MLNAAFAFLSSLFFPGSFFMPRVQQWQPDAASVGTLLLFNKPFGVLTQFTGEPGQRTLKEFIAVPDVYAAGRLDADSEGLLLLTNDGPLAHRITDPRHKLPKSYLAQVEGEPDEAALAHLARGVDLGDFFTAGVLAQRIDPPDWLWPRDPPIRQRKSIPVSWLRLVLREGKNRQVRRMTAKVGYPTLRLVRESIGPWAVGALSPGQWVHLDTATARCMLDAWVRKKNRS